MTNASLTTHIKTFTNCFVLASTLIVVLAVLWPAPSHAINYNDIRAEGRYSVEMIDNYAHVIKLKVTPNPYYSEVHGGVKTLKIRYGQNYDLPHPTVIKIDGSPEEVTLSGLASSQTYWVEISCTYNDDRSCITIKEDFSTRPNRPRFLKVIYRGSNDATVRWKRPYRSDYWVRTNIKLYKRQPNKVKKLKLIQEEYLVGTPHKYYFRRLYPDTKYSYKVRVRILNGQWSRWSDKKRFRTLPENVE
ncbi:MAG: fibronectin type III domain-containing protein [Candidatus Kerfeldbacteria bacterium]